MDEAYEYRAEIDFKPDRHGGRKHKFSVSDNSRMFDLVARLRRSDAVERVVVYWRLRPVPPPEWEITEL